MAIEENRLIKKVCSLGKPVLNWTLLDQSPLGQQKTLFSDRCLRFINCKDNKSLLTNSPSNKNCRCEYIDMHISIVAHLLLPYSV